MAWRALDELEGSLRRTWQRRLAAGVVESYVDPESRRRMIWLSWPGSRPATVSEVAEEAGAETRAA